MGSTALCSLTWENVRRASVLILQGRLAAVWAAYRNRVNASAVASAQEGGVHEAFPLRPLNPHQPLISVVIPCFNYGSYVTAAVDSILSQTVDNVEVIVVDGGSTDGITRERLARLHRPRTRIFLREGRHLVGSNRNFGIERARGRFVCCLDADDTVAPTYLEKAAFLLETYGYDCVSTAIRFEGARSGTVGVLEFPDLRSMMHGNHMHTCAVFRRSIWRSIGGFHDTGVGADHVAEDWDFWLRVAAEGGRMRNIAHEPLFHYRIHEQGSLSTTNVRPIADQRTSILQRNANLLGVDRQEASASRARRIMRCVVQGGALSATMQRKSEDSRRCLLIAMPFLLVGGAERLLSTMAGCLHKEGWRIVVLTTVQQDAADGDSISWFEQHTSEIYRLPAFLQEAEWDTFVDYLVTSRQPDCLLLAGSRYVYKRLPHLRQLLPKMAIVDLLFNTIGHTAAHSEHRSFITSVIAENEQVRQWFLDEGWRPELVSLVESGVDTDSHVPRPRDSVWRAKHGIGADDFVVGFSGRISEEKGPDIFLEIANYCAEVSGIHFVMTGTGPLARTIQARLAEQSCENVHFLGLVEDVHQTIGQYDVLVVPSRIDGRPQVVLEAMSMGVPVIAASIGGLPALVRDQHTGFLCCADNAREFAARVLDLASNPSLLASMKLASREVAVATLGLQQMAKGYNDAFRRAARLCQGQSPTLHNSGGKLKSAPLQ